MYIGLDENTLYSGQICLKFEFSQDFGKIFKNEISWKSVL